MYKTNAGLYFLSTLKDDDIKVIDPTTDLYPFMVAASDNNMSNLFAVSYIFLRTRNLFLFLVHGGNPGEVRRSRRRRSTNVRNRTSNSTKHKDYGGYI